MDAIYARLDNLDLVARSQWVGKGKMLSAAKQATSIKFDTTVGHCLRDLDLDFTKVYMT